MNRIRSFFSIQYPYPNPIQQNRARGLLYLFIICFAMWLLAAIVFVLTPILLIDGDITLSRLVMLLVPPLLIIMGARLVQQGRLTVASLLVVVVLTPFTIVSINDYGLDSASLLTLSLPLITAGLLLSRRWTIILTLLSVAALMAFAQAEYRNISTLFETNFTPVFFTLFIVSAFLLIFTDDYEPVVQRHIDSTEHLQIVGRFSAGHTDNTEISVYVNTLNLIRDNLGYDFTQIFFVDDQGRIEQRLRIHLGVGDETHVINPVKVIETSSLVEALRSQQSVVVSLTDDPLRRQHLISSIRFAMAIPVVIKGRTAAIIDVQSMAKPFNEQRRLILDTLGDIVAGLVMDARMIKSLRDAIDEHAATANALRVEVRKLKGSERQIVGGDWETYLEQRKVDAIGFNSNGGRELTITPAYDLPPELSHAIQNGHAQVFTREDEQIVAVPIILREEVLGAMTFSVPLNRVVTEKDLDATRQIAQRLAIALENKRLFEQSQSRAFRERKAGEIAGVLIGATDVESVLSLAADSFNEALGAVSTRIHLQPDIL